MDVSVIIVNYKSPHFTLQCIESIYQFTKGIEFEIIVVDNNSGDDSVNLIASKFPGVVMLPMKNNIGYSRANNEGMKKARGKYFLVLNNDTIFIENILLPLYSSMEKDKSIAASCIGLYYPDRVRQASGFNFVFGGLNMILTLPFFPSIAGVIKKVFNLSSRETHPSSGLQAIDWISGAFMFVRKTGVDKAGAFDEDFFLFSEEIEWCYRLNKTGKIMIHNDLSIIHLVGQTIDTEMNADKDNYFPYWQKKGLQLMVSNLLRIRKQHGILMLLVHIWIYFLEIPVFFIGVTISKINSNKSKFTYTQLYKYCKNCFSLLSYAGPIIFKKRKLYKVI